MLAATAALPAAQAPVSRPPATAAAPLPERSPATGTHGPTVDRAIFDRYCVTCHNERLKRGNLVLAGLPLDSLRANGDVWEKVVRKLRSGEMPPPGAPRPDRAVVLATATALENTLDREAAAYPDPGRVAIHRLNRTEYANAIRDILALEVDATTLLPVDETGYGFDNIAGVLSMSPGLLERYKLAAWKISRLAVGDPQMKPVTEQFKISRLLVQDDRMNDDLPFGSRGGGVIKHTFPVDGEYSIKIELQRAYAAHVIRGIAEREQIDLRVNGERVKLFPIGGECVGSKEPRCVAFRPTYEQAAANGQAAVRELPAEYDLTADKDLVVRFHAKAGPASIQLSFLRVSAAAVEGAGPPRLPATVSQNDSSAGLMAIESIRLEGPFNVTGPGDTPNRRRIFVCRPAAADERPCARTILSTLARRAYRRPLAPRDLDTLMAFYERGRKAGRFDTGIQYALEAMLMSSNFLLRTAQDPASVPPSRHYRLSDLELASRLSFFLWSSVPDDELLGLAERRALNDPKVLEQQVKRMLADRRSSALVQHFLGQWLSLRDLKNVSPDPAAYPDFDDSLREAFLRETTMFLDSQVREDRSVAELLSADYTYANERLARFYGIRGVYGSHFRRVALGDPNRVGLLGHGSILTITSYSTRTSPVVRGKWLLTNVLGAPPPPPPPDVPALKENGEGGEPPSTVRARMEQHRKNAVCATCHSRMDPMGFALENFNAIGKWRTTEVGAPLDASGVFPDGAAFSSPAEFRTLLLTHRDEFVQTVTIKLLTYALGRGVEFYDMPVVRRIIRDAAASDYRWSSLILGITNSLPFQMNRVADPESPSHQVAARQ
jgi:mono/diheme cytochrome c family protein